MVRLPRFASSSVYLPIDRVWLSTITGSVAVNKPQCWSQANASRLAQRDAGIRASSSATIPHTGILNARTGLRGSNPEVPLRPFRTYPRSSFKRLEHLGHSRKICSVALNDTYLTLGDLYTNTGIPENALRSSEGTQFFHPSSDLMTGSSDSHEMTFSFPPMVTHPCSVSAGCCSIFTDHQQPPKGPRICAHREIIIILDRTMCSGFGIELESHQDLRRRGRIQKIPPWSRWTLAFLILLSVGVRTGRKPMSAGCTYRFEGTGAGVSAWRIYGNTYLSCAFAGWRLFIGAARSYSSSPTGMHRVWHGSLTVFENMPLRGALDKKDGGSRTAVGGADWVACIWEHPGHMGTVAPVESYPKEPVILTSSREGGALLKEIEVTATV
ncbi:hypothetical protein BKA70DRAFT_1434504 [Coprinopsis sp. MPI-PUGE-AT-0042]|nr:hypothetical protein BKA70DRAFT_1434504 [Coprinopsis sp. MPI-PUGE-AT-0042]